MATIEGAKRDGHTIWFRRVNQPVSRSRLGGLPSLPRGVEWPVNTRTKAPLHFLGQVDLSALPPLPFPGDADGPVLPDGMLYFFMALGTNSSHEPGVGGDRLQALNLINSRVVYAPTAGVDHPLPVDLPVIWYLEQEGHQVVTFPEAPLVAHMVDMDQPTDALIAAIEKVTGEVAPILDSTTFDNAWPTKMPSYRIWRRPSVSDFAQVDPLIMFGTPYQGLQETALAKAEGRHLLLQFVDANLGEMLSCEGVIQFWILPKDLRECRFHRAWGTLEAI